MTLIDLANPTKFLAPTARALPWLAAVTAVLLALGLYQSATAPDDSQQGATVKIMFIHVPNAWLSMLVCGVMSGAALGTLVWLHPLADVAAKVGAPIGAAFTFLAPVTVLILGAADVGHLLGMGLAAHVSVDPVPDVARLDGAVASGRRPCALGTRRCGADARWRDQPADHQIFGRLVEHAASASLGVPGRRADARSCFPRSAAGDGARLHAAVRNPATGGDAQ